MTNVPIRQASECSICLESYTNKKFPVCLPCGHVRCQECEPGLSQTPPPDGQSLSSRASQIFRSCQGEPSRTCPFCRQEYKPTDVRRIYNNAAESMTNEFDNMQSKVNELMEENRRLTNEMAEINAFTPIVELGKVRLVKDEKWS